MNAGYVLFNGGTNIDNIVNVGDNAARIYRHELGHWCIDAVNGFYVLDVTIGPVTLHGTLYVTSRGLTTFTINSVR